MTTTQRASRWLLPAAALFAVPGVNAVTLNPRGVGQALIYPYYTVNADQDTLISVINVGDTGKAVRVRFLESYDQRDVLDLDVYLSPHDVWTGTVTADAAGGARLVSRDRSCTFPPLPSEGVAFLSDGYAGANTDGGPTGIARTREGSMQLIALGDVAAGSATAGRIAHDVTDAGTPRGCGEITTTNVAGDLAVPGDDLFGAGAVVNVGLGTYYPYNADALSGFTSQVLYTPSAADGPDLRSANSQEATRGKARAYVNVGKGVLALDYARGEDAVSAVFMTQTLYNEYVDASAIDAATDWVVTFPTKHYYVDAALGPASTAPFDEPFTAPGLSDVELQADFYDREDRAFATHAPPDGCGFACPETPPLALSYAVNVLRVLPRHTAPQASEVFGSTLSRALLPFAFPSGVDLPPLFTAGWVDLHLDGDARVLTGGQRDVDGRAVSLHGLPVTGFMAYDVINAYAQPGKLANYSGVFPHRSEASCTFGSDAQCP